ncbi:MAG: AraC family transcriptional regulator [Polyangiales bacterium]
MTERLNHMTERRKPQADAPSAGVADALSEVLRAVRLKSAVFFDVAAKEPWCAEAPQAVEIGPYIMPGIEHVIEYHVVTSGTCFAGLVGEPAIKLEAGDIIVFPQGDAHVMSSAPGMRGELNNAHEQLGPGSLPIAMRIGDGADVSVHLICGFLGCDARPFNPLIAHLPRVLHVPARHNRDGVVEQFVRLALGESGSLSAGSQCMLARLSELMFIEAVRRHLSELPNDGTGWLAGLRDPCVGHVLSKLHAQPARDWTLAELAREAATSRSMLAERFAQLVGIPPMQYLAQWRIQLAAGLLTGGTQSLAEIATQVGYGSETALSRAFKREVGVSPAHWRKGQRVADSAEAAP